MPCGLFFETYEKDEAIFQTTFLRLAMSALAVLLLAFPFFADWLSGLTNLYWLGIMTHICIFVLGAQGLNLLTGFTGQISLGHGAFMAVGAFTAGVLHMDLGWNFLLAILAGGLMTATLGMIFGVPSLRLRGLYLAIATLAAQIIIIWLLRGIFEAGAVEVSDATLLGFSFDTDERKYYLCLFFAALGTLYLKNLMRTRTGRAFVAVRDRYLSAEVIGVNLFKYRIMSFGISSFMVGLAGGLWAFTENAVTDEAFGVALSVKYLAYIIVGGLGQVTGAIFGVTFLELLHWLLEVPTDALSRIFPNIFEKLASLREIVFGLIVIVFLIFEPDGLGARWRTIRSYWKLWPFSY